MVSGNGSVKGSMQNMTCKSCGCELNGKERFCGNCGEPVSQLEKKAEEYINIGHPLGYTKINNQVVYLMDNGLQQVQMLQEIFAVWAKLPQEIPNENDISVLERMNCVLRVGELEQQNELMRCVPYRQGFGATQGGKHVVGLGNTALILTEIQMTVWRLCDGRNTVGRIGLLMGMDNRDIADILFDLIGYDLVYLKFAR